jgi:hypothetical protein
MNLARVNNWFSKRRTPRLDLLIFAAMLMLTWSVYKLSHGAQWAEKIGFATVFCALIWMKDESPSGRWLVIGIVTVGTALSLLFSL